MASIESKPNSSEMNGNKEQENDLWRERQHDDWSSRDGGNILGNSVESKRVSATDLHEDLSNINYILEHGNPVRKKGRASARASARASTRGKLLKIKQDESSSGWQYLLEMIESITLEETFENFGDRLYVWAENMTSADRKFPLLALLLSFVAFILLYAIVWYCITTFNRDDDEIDAAGGEVLGTADWGDSFFAVIQLLMAYGVNRVPNYNGIHFVYVLINITGMLLLAVIVAFLTDAVTDASRILLAGRSRVFEKDHTIILGYNEATLRTIVQICFIRRIYQQVNEEKFSIFGFNVLYHIPWLYTILGWLNRLEPPSTSLAVGNIVLMASDISKETMHLQIAEIFNERGINPKRTRLGTNIICRTGNPSNVHDLLRIRADKAAACLIMMNNEDYQVVDNDAYLQNGATLRSLLAYRYVVLSNPYDSNNIIHPELRIVVQMSSPSVYINTASFPSPTGVEVVHPLDLTLFANTLMFGCVAHNGMARIFLSLLNLEGKCIRRRRSQNFRSGPERKLGDCIGRTFGELARELDGSALIGLVRPQFNDPADLLQKKLGLCPDPGHLIKEDDLLIFVSSVTSPNTSQDAVNQMIEFEAEAHRRVRDDPLLNETRESLTKRNVCVIGWRSIWETEMYRFRHRLDEIFDMSLPYSTLTFVCNLEIETMKNLLETVGLTFINIIPPEGDKTTHARRSMRGSNIPATKAPFVCARAEYMMPSPYDHCKVIHVEGDGVLPEVIEPVIYERRIDTAIVLGTRAMRQSDNEDDLLRKDANTDGFSRDTRVLSILLLLRKIHNSKGDQFPMHVVGENTEDVTEKLALYPAWNKRKRKSTGSSNTIKRRGTVLSEHIREEMSHHIPDFVNTQAMYARALVQTLAYPMISSAIIQLFDKRGANLELLRCAAYVPLLKPIKFGLVKAIVAARGRESYTDYHGNTFTQEAICVGHITSEGEQHLVPPGDTEIVFDEGCRLIAITRKDDELDGAPPIIEGDASSEYVSRLNSIYGAEELYGRLPGIADEEEEEEEEEEDEEDEEDEEEEEERLDDDDDRSKTRSVNFSMDDVYPDKAEVEVKYSEVSQTPPLAPAPEESAPLAQTSEEPHPPSQFSGTENDDDGVQK